MDGAVIDLPFRLLVSVFERGQVLAIEERGRAGRRLLGAFVFLAGIGADDAVRRANAAGAIVASRLSCSTAMPRAAEIDALLEGGSVVDGAVVAR